MKQIAELQAALTAAAIRVARSVAEAHVPERVYSFALYTSGEYNYVTVTFSTETGLRKTAERYLATEPYRSEWRSVEEASKQLRWSPCDSPHHEEYGEEFEEAGALLNGLWEAIDEESEDQYQELAEAVHMALLNALIVVRDQSILEKGVVLNLLKGDQSDEERLQNSLAVNWPETHNSYAQELEQ